MERLRFARWESEPLEAVATTVKLPVVASDAAENTTAVLELAATVKGLAGFELIPAGKPLNATWTVAENPPIGATDRFTAGLVTPCCRLTEAWENEMEKSGWGGGGGNC